MKIDYSTNLSFFKLPEIDNSNNYIFELSKDALKILTNIFKTFAELKTSSKNNPKGI